MGYYLHIIRKKSYAEWEETSNISLEEWRAYIDLDEELELKDAYEITLPDGKTVRNDSPGYCHWLTHFYQDTEHPIWFDYGQGSIGSKYPDEETIAKMIRIANILQAKVQGDDGEFYDETWLETGKAVYLDDEDPDAPGNHDGKNEKDPIPAAIKKPWWKLW
ncbi:hypothetical protein [Chitinophaga silvisoli]|uniref:Uncharacterized protein n=1 Tax=Chitinophaga silvisoli TaxID=2291814 RepID=A0A3E1NW80_9BACT|nr:hypothetical protein [Chitinophaga silvisoli]RFM32008.1 hypothetical protein DXN04_24785 [Chitinophaga silvisoli]